MKSFIAVARLKSFSAAARELNTVQPAISRHISDLETELNTCLFWRNTREVNITSAGEVLLQEALEIVAHEERARTLVKLASSGQVGRLRIGYLGPACYLFLPKLVQKFSETYPDVLISLHELTAQEQLEAFQKGTIDIGFSRPVPRMDRASFDSKAVYQDRLIAFVPLDHPLSSTLRKSIRLSELADERFVLFTRRGAPMLFHLVIKACQNAGFEPNVSSEPGTMQTVLTEVSAGLGVSIAPSCILGLKLVECRGLMIEDCEDKIPLEIQCKNGPMPRALEAFTELTMSFANSIQALIDRTAMPENQ
ncbi:LysR family transcriptional regulator [Planktotalea sp.]|uniref:LysR family transcriptional regulator n=1 Tax=Planktotalea sp. TaxID=2029877 RepID=UPI0032980984